jgi:hypothetical protein
MVKVWNRDALVAVTTTEKDPAEAAFTLKLTDDPSGVRETVVGFREADRPFEEFRDSVTKPENPWRLVNVIASVPLTLA